MHKKCLNFATNHLKSELLILVKLVDPILYTFSNQKKSMNTLYKFIALFSASLLLFNYFIVFCFVLIVLIMLLSFQGQKFVLFNLKVLHCKELEIKEFQIL